MTVFDRVAMVDWSAGNDRGPRPRKDAIWSAVVRDGAAPEVAYLRNRDVAFEHVSAMIAEALSARSRLLVGFDFPFGYPAGFARAVTGSDDPLALWGFFADTLVDTPRGNDRFALAGRLNARLGGTGPFWFNGTQDDIAHLPRKGTERRGHGMKERREVETLRKGTFTCWQMGGAGAVGGQVMTGLAVLERLRRAYPGQIAVWPFQPLDRPVAFVEIWPGLIDAAVRASADPIRDRAQVRLLAQALSRLPADRLAAMLDVEAPEEGWILGVGHEEELSRLAWPN